MTTENVQNQIILQNNFHWEKDIPRSIASEPPHLVLAKRTRPMNSPAERVPALDE